MMDPIGFGIVFVGATGVTLLALTGLERKLPINEKAMKLVMETVKYGTLLYLVGKVFTLFL